MNRLWIFLVFMVASGGDLAAQQNTQTYITEYYRLVSANRDSALSLCDQLIETNVPGKRAFGYAGKAHLSALKSEFVEADEFYQKADFFLQKTDLTERDSLRKHIEYFRALRLIESHELEGAIEMLSEISNSCEEGCLWQLTLGVQSALARAYGLSPVPRGLEVLKITHRTLNRLGDLLDGPEGEQFEVKYANELINAGGRALNLFIADKEKFSDYLDSSKYYSELAERFIEDNAIEGLEGRILIRYADINFHDTRFEKAKYYYEQALSIYRDENRKKRIEQILFRIGECHFSLKEYDQAKAIFTRQLEDEVLLEYQLLDFDERCHYYLFSIYAETGDSKKALEHANVYFEKMAEYYKTKNESDLKLNNLFHAESHAKEISAYVDNYNKQSTQKRILAGLSVLLFLIIIFTVIYYVRANKNNIKNLNKRIKELQQDVNKTSSTKNSGLTDANAQILLAKLKELEKEELYLRPDYSLNLVARTLGTNTSYLSKTVNAYLGISFAEYSNRLKVNSIVMKLKKHRYYRNYTIDALANEAGYKSVNSYNSNFKKILKVTPSQYLKELNKLRD